MALSPLAAPWSAVEGGLQIRLIAPDRRPVPRTTLEVGLAFRNAGPDPLRLYWLASAPFRAMQSVLHLTAQPGARFLAVGPELRPHGYVVTEKDFVLLAPGEEWQTTQDLWLPASVEIQPSDTLVLGWSYQNDVTAWPGGIPTLDGPTHALFGGGPIPHIWTGRLESVVTLPPVG
jgi:hypothetical protein